MEWKNTVLYDRDRCWLLIGSGAVVLRTLNELKNKKMVLLQSQPHEITRKAENSKLSLLRDGKKSKSDSYRSSLTPAQCSSGGVKQCGGWERKRECGDHVQPSQCEPFRRRDQTDKEKLYKNYQGPSR